MNLVLASASPRRRELLAQCGYTFSVHPAHIPEDPLPNEDPIAYVTRLARQKAKAVFRQLTRPSALSPDASVLYQGTTPAVPQSPQTEQRALAPASVPFPPPLGAPRLASETGEGSPLSINNPGAFSINTTDARASLPRASAPPQVVLGADTTVVIDNQILAKPIDAADAARMLRLLSGRTHRVITGVAVVTAQRTEVAAEVTGVRFLTLSEEEIAAYIATGEPMDKAGAYAIQGRAARWIPRITGDYFNVVGLPLALVSTMLEAVATLSISL